MSPNTPATDTFVACLTPPGLGAIACLAVRGPRAWEVVRELFQPHASHPLPGEPEMGPLWLGRLGAEVADEVVVSVKAAHPVPWVEVHCHGGREAVRMLEEAFTRRGIQARSWKQFERGADGDPLRAAAAALLAEALTVRTAGILLDQYQGAFRHAVAAIQAAGERGDQETVGRLLDRLRRYVPVGRHLGTPWRVVVAGAPNVGKSSLVNALAGFQRCVVAPTPGTTRDVVTTLIAVEGWPVELADTAGLRDAAGMVEQQGIGLARAAATAADLCLWVLDASQPPVWPKLPTAALAFVINKVDLEPAWDLGEAAGALHVSARSGSGLTELCQALADWLVPDSLPAGVAVPFTPDLCDRVEEACHHHEAGRFDEARKALAVSPRALRRARPG
jgi:tRNA modification GTPase